MGLTHFWRRPASLSPVAFAAAVADVRRVLAAAGVPLAGPDGEGEPVLRADVIALNGRSPADCEPFVFHSSEPEHRRGGDRAVSSFCKTRGLPYDLAVKAALVVLAHHLGGALSVASDEPDDAWAVARALVAQVVGYGGDFRLGRRG